MGDPKGFLKHGRGAIPKRPSAERVRDYRWVYEPMPEKELRDQASRCMDCGVPFCNTGCPVNNLIPDWNHLVYKDHWKQAIDRLHSTNNFPVRDRLLEDLKLEIGERGHIISDDRYGTGTPGVFVAGDARRGASLIVWAIAEGRKAAPQADLYLMGESRLPPSSRVPGKCPQGK